MYLKKAFGLLLTCLFVISCQTTPFIKSNSDNWEILYTESDSEQARQISSLLQEKYYGIRDILNPSYNKKITIKIYPDLSSFNTARSAIGFPPGKPNGGNAVGTTKIMLVSSMHYEVVIHEYTHLVINSFAGSPQSSSWIDESVCYYLAKQDYGSIDYLKATYKKYNHFDNFTQNSHYVKTLYYMGKFIFENYSSEQIKVLLKTRSIKTALKMSPDDYLEAWYKWVEVQ